MTPSLSIQWPRGLDARRFLARYWQKAPLLVRGAFPAWRDTLPRARLTALAQRDDVESRLISHSHHREGVRYRVDHGPQGTRALTRLGRPDATLLVQGVNLHAEGTARVLDAFDFVPLARRDDLMVSDASPGGGVGPHVDSYDVFLLQARGRRLWRIATAFDETLDEAAPLKLLARFEAEDEYLLEPGDFLYLPPGVAHDGIALDDCATWSIGFRAPSARDLAQGWLAFLEDRFDRDALYADPDLRLQRSPAWLSDQFVERARGLLGRLAFDRSQFELFLGCWLTEPKPDVRYRAPARALSFETFSARAAENGVALVPATRMLHRGAQVFINGEACAVSARAKPAAVRLADARALPAAANVSGKASAARSESLWLRTLYGWYCSGYIVVR
jgi:50S ribosomal protein L16 3-hydroxylase